ncbi:hypothetical protein [Flavobacterium sp.]|uniref:hypothetical protein n=1 Tax=Flavobacterium sp. TaxID=239 RepID=UPI00262395C3|nr:hypothetical protein [Flavobacterium sp.]
MNLQLTSEEIDAVILSILCNGALSFASQSGLDYDYDRQHYKAIKEANPILNCYEDVLLGMLKDGGKIQIIDQEGGEDSEYNKDLTLKLATEQLSNVTDPEFAEYVITSVREEGDAETDYSILQFILYDEIVFG